MHIHPIEPRACGWSGSAKAGIIAAALWMSMVGSTLADKTLYVVRKVPIASGRTDQGLGFDGTNFWISNWFGDDVNVVDPLTGNTLRTVHLQVHPEPADNEWVNGEWWHSDGMGYIYKVDPVSGAVLHTLNEPTGNPTGLAWDGSHMWYADDQSDKIYRLADLVTGTRDRTLSMPNLSDPGLTYHDGRLWKAFGSPSKVNRINPDNGAVEESYVTADPSDQPYLIKWAGGYFWGLAGSRYLVKYSLASGHVVNGDFSEGNSGFTSQLTYTPGSTYQPPGTYAIVANPHDVHAPEWCSYGDHTTGSGYMMVVNGPSSLPIVVWAQTVAVNPATTYRFSMWVSICGGPDPATLRVRINGLPIIPAYTPSYPVGIWREVAAYWDSGISSTAAVEIVNTAGNTANGDDFALDDIELSAGQLYLSTTVSTPPGKDGSSQTTTCNLNANGMPQCSGSGSSPIFVKSGDYRTRADDAVIPARGIPIQITRFYNSIENYDGAFSYGWNFNYTIQLMRTAATNGSEQAIVRWANGVRKDFLLTNGAYRAPVGCYDTLTTNAAGFRLQMKSGMALLFNQSGFLTSQVDRVGNALTLDYNLQNRLSRVTAADGRHIDYAYGSNGRVTNIVDWTSRRWSYTYDGRDDLVRVTYPDGGFITYTYATNHQLTAIDDARSNRVSALTYESNTTARATSYSEGADVSFQMAYNPASNLTVKTDSNGRQSSFRYNEYGNKTNWVNPANHQLRFSWTSNQQINARTDARGNPQYYQYDNRGNVVLTSNALGFVTRYTYETNFNRVTSVVDPLGNSVTNAYDAKGNLLSSTDARGFTTQYRYDTCGHVTNAIDARSNLTVMVYDHYGNLLSSTDPLGSTVSYAYDGRGNRISMTDARSNTWTYGYDAMDRLVAATNPLGQATSYAYDANGNQVSITDARSNTTWFAYDGYNRLVATTNALGYGVTSGYDIYGNVVWMRDPMGNVNSNSFDILNRLISTTDPLGNPTSFAYDPNGNRVAVTDALNNATRYVFDPLNRVTAMTNALGGVWRYQYDANGNVLSVTDARNNTSFSVYDVRNMVTNSANALGHAYRYEYDGNGNAVRRTDPNGAVLDYAYDAVNRLTNIAYPDGSRLTFAYDPNGNVLALSNSTETVQYAYDPLNRVTNVFVVGLNKTVRFEYDSVGNRSAMIDPSGGRTEYSYDALNRLTALRDPAINTWAFAFDALNRTTNMTMPNGIAATYQYDAGSRLTNLVYRTSANTILQSFDYAYDAVGNPLRVQREDNLWELYQYDKTYQLTRVDYDATNTVSSTNWACYLYDPVGNRTNLLRPDLTEKYVYDAANRLLSVTSASSVAFFSWDNNGNLTNKLENGTNTWYSWDFENKMVTIRYQDARTNVFSYYPSSSLRHTKVDSTGTNRYVYDGQNELQQLDGLGTLVAQYVYSLGIDSLLASSAGGDQQYYLRDMIGSVTAVADSSQNLLVAYRYDAFGTVRRQAGDPNNPYLFTSRMLDQDSGLYYYRARYLSPARGLFLAVDPQMQAHPYLYAANNPLAFNDPDGEFFHIAIAAGIGAAIGGGLEFGAQLMGNLGSGKDVSEWEWDTGRIVGSTVSGALIGGVAGLTGGGSLLVMGATGAGAEFVGQAAGKAWNNAGLGRQEEKGENPLDLASYDYGRVLAGGVFGVVGTGASKIAGHFASSGVGRPVENVYKSLAGGYWGPNVSAELQRQAIGQTLSRGLIKAFSGKENLGTVFDQAAGAGVSSWAVERSPFILGGGGGGAEDGCHE